MLIVGARKRIARALEPHIEGDETLRVSSFTYVMGKGDYVIGLTDRRLIMVEVGKLSSRPTGKTDNEDLATMVANPNFTRPIYLEHFSSKILTFTRSSGEVWKLRFDTPFWADAEQIRQALTPE